MPYRVSACERRTSNRVRRTTTAHRGRAVSSSVVQLINTAFRFRKSPRANSRTSKATLPGRKGDLVGCSVCAP